MSQTAIDLTLDQYLKRYAKTVKALSMDDYFLSLYDYDKNGKIDRGTAESRTYNKLSGDDKQRMYTEYLDSVVKLNAYYKREAQKEWEAAHYFSSEDAEYTNPFGDKSMTTVAVERMENENKYMLMKSGLNIGKLAILALLAVGFIMLMKK